MPGTVSLASGDGMTVRRQDSTRWREPECRALSAAEPSQPQVQWAGPLQVAVIPLAVIPLHTPLPAAGVSTRMERGCQQNGRTLAGGYL